MFTAENSTFDAADRETLNAALTELLKGCDEEQRAELEKSLSDRLNNAWYAGITVDELVRKADFK